MAGFEDQLNSILGNQEAMSQIMALARSLSSGSQTEPAPALEGPPEGAEPAPPALEEPPGVPDLSALLGQIDPKMLQAGMEIVRQVQGTEDRNTALLNALRPFLREARLDRAMQIARMTRIIRVALTALGGKEGERV